ncbi:hypothetical protein GWK47_021620 [Chionoecetes opilio]|uniref:Uncharacterized protein n=1 Tax=Chionoecetes opilio TaxID=41210 RepID=A0A8J5CE94_CHIOP|nr:hypothetical protein GWK47_021620 [Chionoecetes opilio]
MGVEQPGGGEELGEAGQGVTTFHRLPSDPLHPGSLLSPASAGVVTPGSAGDGGTINGGISGYSSYVITIDGISTVFSNPVRLSPALSQQPGDTLPTPVQVITGDILSQDPKVTYDPDTKLSPESQFTPQDKVRSGHESIYAVTSGSKCVGQGLGGREFPPTDLPQTVLLQPSV